MTQDDLREFAQRYTAAWCGGEGAAVAAFFAEDGSLTVNGGAPAVGRAAIAAVADSFFGVFPDMRVACDDVVELGVGRAEYHWTLTGTSVTTGRRVRVSGCERWRLGDGCIAVSDGQFDAGEYERQLAGAAPLYLDEVEVRRRLRMPQLIDCMERALVAFSGGGVEQPVRTVMMFGAERSFFGLMPCYVPALPALGAKLVTVAHGNAGRGLDTHQALIVMLDPVTGAVRALLDGRYITEARTAAVSAVSARWLAREDARVLGVLGSGVQARSHVEALRLVRPFEEVRVWSPNAERCARFAQEVGARAMASAEEVVRGADVVAAVTASATPVVQSEWVSDGCHVIAVGACVPGQRELDPALVARSRLIVDSRAAALKEAGDVVMGIAEGRWTAGHIAAELGERPARRDAQEITVFKSLGLAVEDVFAAALVLG